MGCLPKVVCADFDCQKVQHISCNTGSRALPHIVRTRPRALRALWRRVYISGNALQPVLQLLRVTSSANKCFTYHIHFHLTIVVSLGTKV